MRSPILCPVQNRWIKNVWASSGPTESHFAQIHLLHLPRNKHWGYSSNDVTMVCLYTVVHCYWLRNVLCWVVFLNTLPLTWGNVLGCCGTLNKEGMARGSTSLWGLQPRPSSKGLFSVLPRCKELNHCVEPAAPMPSRDWWDWYPETVRWDEFLPVSCFCQYLGTMREVTEIHCWCSLGDHNQMGEEEARVLLFLLFLCC